VTGDRVGAEIATRDRVVNRIAAVPGAARPLLAAAGCDSEYVQCWDPLTGEPVGEAMETEGRVDAALVALRGPGGRPLIERGPEGGDFRRIFERAFSLSPDGERLHFYYGRGSAGQAMTFDLRRLRLEAETGEASAEAAGPHAPDVLTEWRNASRPRWRGTAIPLEAIDREYCDENDLPPGERIPITHLLG